MNKIFLLVFVAALLISCNKKADEVVVDQNAEESHPVVENTSQRTADIIVEEVESEEWVFPAIIGIEQAFSLMGKAVPENFERNDDNTFTYESADGSRIMVTHKNNIIEGWFIMYFDDSLNEAKNRPIPFFDFVKKNKWELSDEGYRYDTTDTIYTKDGVFLYCTSKPWQGNNPWGNTSETFFRSWIGFAKDLESEVYGH